MIYILLGLFVPYGIIGTWRTKNLEWRAAWQERLKRFSTGHEK